MTEASQITHWQKRMFWLCWFAYACGYFCRVNLAVALPAIGAEFEWSKAQLGLLGSIFFWSYAVGQLVNGSLGDRVNSRLFIWLGLLGSSIINLSFGLASTLPMMAILWAVNGVFQSMLWGPIVKTLALWLPPAERARTAVRISTSMVGGYFLAWGVCGQVVLRYGWRWSFWLPAIVVSLFAFLWLVLARESPAALGLPSILHERGPDMSVHRSHTNNRLWSLALGSGLLLTAVACVAQGVVKEGISLWAPTLLLDLAGADGNAFLLTLLIPALNFFGILLSGWLVKWCKQQERSAIVLLLVLCGVASAGLLLLRPGLLGTAILLAGASCFIYGANTLLLSVIPLGYASQGLTSSIAGFLNFAAYLGAALAGLLNGWLVDLGGWQRVIMLWCIASLVGVFCVAASRNRDQVAAPDVDKGIA